MRFATSITLAGIVGYALAAAAQDKPQVPDALLSPPGQAVPEALIPAPTNLLAHALSATNAEAAWSELQTASQPPSPPEAWEANKPSEKEQTDFFQPYVLALMDKSKDFYTRFPKDAHVNDARKQEFELTRIVLQMGATNQQARFDAEEKTLLADPKLTEDERFAIRQSDVERAAKAKEPEGEAAVLAQYEKDTRALQKEFPKRPEIFGMLLDLAGNAEPAKARVILQEITNSPAASDELKTAAADQLKKFDTIGKPVDLKFTAVDGREVDLSQMKGKVVLIDFWATWCGPCVEEMPEVKATYATNHAKGFEIVGISLDREKSSLTDYVAKNQMPWPQFFDGDNKYAKQFDVDSIPTMWLIDKKGNLRDINGRSDLGGKVGKLLAE